MMEIDDYNFCKLLQMEPVPTMPEEDLMNTEVAIMTGGRDQGGRPLVTFPAQHHGILESRVMGSGLDRILRYYIDVTSPTTKVHGFAFIADLRFSTMDFISMLKTSLNSLQAETTSIVSPFVLYVIQPLNKKSLKEIQTLLAIRHSKKKKNKHIAAPLFQTTIVADEMDLYNHVDKSQVTADLGGYLQYSHQAWIRFRKTVEPFFLGYEKMVEKLPDSFTRLEELENFELGKTKQELEEQKDHIQQLLQDLFRELNIDAINEHCDDLLAKINRPDSDETFTAIAQKPVFREVKLLAEFCREKLTMAHQRLAAAKDRVKGRVDNEMKRLDLADEIQKLCDWLSREGPASLKKLEIADSLGRAEMLCNHFETAVASLAEEKLSQATKLHEEAESMMTELHRSVTDVRTGIRDLEGHADAYHRLLDERRQLLSTVRNYYGLYDTVARWCVKALKFLPADIADIYDEIRSNRLGGQRRRQGETDEVEYQWLDDIERFLGKNQPPKDEDLLAMMEFAETIDERVRKKKAKSLYNRCTLLFRVLDTNELATNKDVLQVLKWRSQVIGSQGDSSAHEDVKKRSLRRGDKKSPERKEGDGVEEEARTDVEERSEREPEIEIDDPLLRRIGKQAVVNSQEVKGHISKRSSPQEDNDMSQTDEVGHPRNAMGHSEKGRRGSDKGEGSKGMRKSRRDGKVKRGEAGRAIDYQSKEGLTESEQSDSQWVRPSKDFWSGRIPGVVHSSPANGLGTYGKDAVDGTRVLPENVSLGISTRHGIQNGAYKDSNSSGSPYFNSNVAASNYPIANVAANAFPVVYPSATSGYPDTRQTLDYRATGTVPHEPHYLNRNQNANPTPELYGSHPITPASVGHSLYDHLQYQGRTPPVNKWQVGNIQSPREIPAGMVQSPYGVPQGSLTPSLQGIHAQGLPQQAGIGVPNTHVLPQQVGVGVPSAHMSPHQAGLGVPHQGTSAAGLPVLNHIGHISGGGYSNPVSPAQSFTLFDPATGLPYQAAVPSPQSRSMHDDRMSAGYLSDTQRSTHSMHVSKQAYHNPVKDNPGHNNLVHDYSTHKNPAYDQQGVHALDALESSADHLRALNIGLSSSRDSRSGRSTPRSSNRELSPYEDVLDRIAKLRVRAHDRGKRRDKTTKAKSAAMRGAKSVPNLSNVLPDIPGNEADNIVLDLEVGLVNDRQSDYYARLTGLDDRADRIASRHATRKWVNRLMADNSYRSDSYSLRSASPSVEISNSRRVQRPLTPLEKYELESLTSLLNDSSDDNDDSAPISRSPEGAHEVSLGSFDLSPTRTLPSQAAYLDIAGDQEELDRIRQNLSGSFTGAPNHSYNFDSNSNNASKHSPNMHESHLSSPLHPSRSNPHMQPRSVNHNSLSSLASPFAASGVAPLADSRTDSFNSRDVAPVTEQLREYFGDVESLDGQAVQQGLEERLRNVNVSRVEEHITHDHLSTPNFLAEALETLVKMDAMDRRVQGGLPVNARHELQRNPSLQFSDEGVIIDGASWDGTLEAGSAATTERESVESGVGSRGQASNL